MRNALILICFISLFTNCTNNNKQDILTAAGGCDTSVTTYSSTVSKIMLDYCTNCHGGSSPSAGISLESYGDVKTYTDNGKLLGSIKHTAGISPMPQGSGKLDDCTIAKLERWINNGALNN